MSQDELIGVLVVLVPIVIAVIVFLIKAAMEPDAFKFTTFKQIKGNIFSLFQNPGGEKEEIKQEDVESFGKERLEYVGDLLSFAKAKSPQIRRMFETQSKEIKYYPNVSISMQNDLHFVLRVCRHLESLSIEDFKKEIRKRFYKNGVPLPPAELKRAEMENR